MDRPVVPSLGLFLADPHCARGGAEPTRTSPSPFFPTAAPGATIPEGILYGYDGVEWSAASDKGVIGSRSEVGLAYQEICQPRGVPLLLRLGRALVRRTDPRHRAGAGVRIL